MKRVYMLLVSALVGLDSHPDLTGILFPAPMYGRFIKSLLLEVSALEMPLLHDNNYIIKK